ncbi:MAG: MFS transporter [Actinomycetota bacterium]|nr:MFS transporter [Actinomycetota bacterium]
MKRRPVAVVLAGAVGMLGWGAVLPYQYAYAAQTRGWGTLVAVLASSLFSVAALVAAPFGGRLADRLPPVRVAVGAKLVAAAAGVGLLLADSPAAFLVGMSVLGLGITAAQPAQSVLVLRWSGAADRRTVFAWAFTGSSVGMALGALVAAQSVDLSRTDGMRGAFLLAAAGFLVSAGVLALAGRGARGEEAVEGADTDLSAPAGPASTGSALRAVLAVPALRWIAVVTVAISLGFYAQFESGLPAFALTVLHVPEQTIGTAAAVNCLVIVVLQMLVVRLTAGRHPASLLAAVGVIWIGCWGLLAVATRTPGLAATLFVTTFGIFAVGETLFAPLLGPLTAAHAPAGTAGTTLGLLAALQTGVSAGGPLLAGLLLGTGHSGVFLGVHVVVSVFALLAALRLRRVLQEAPSAPPRRPGLPPHLGGTDPERPGGPFVPQGAPVTP